MPQQTQAKVRRRPPAESTDKQAAAKQRAAKVVEQSDELLDEIDAVLNEEEEFAVRYIQKGGE